MNMHQVPCQEVVGDPHHPTCLLPSQVLWCLWNPVDPWVIRGGDLLHLAPYSFSNLELRSWLIRSWAVDSLCLKTSSWLYRGKGACPQCSNSSSHNNSNSSNSPRHLAWVLTTGLEVMLKHLYLLTHLVTYQHCFLSHLLSLSSWFWAF